METYLESINPKSFANGTITEKDEIYETIKQARIDGYTISHSELENHTAAIAAPIFNHNGEVIAGISIAGIEANYQDENIEIYAKKVKKVAEAISMQLGYSK